MRYYVIDDNKCLHESMTKEQTIAAITEAVESHQITDVDTGFVTTVKEKNGGRGVTVWVGSSAEYAQIPLKKQNCLYIITDDEGSNDYAAFLDKINKTLWTGAAQTLSEVAVPNILDYHLLGFVVSDVDHMDVASKTLLYFATPTASGSCKVQINSNTPPTVGLNTANFALSGTISADGLLTISNIKWWGVNESSVSDGYLLKIVGIM